MQDCANDARCKISTSSFHAFNVHFQKPICNQNYPISSSLHSFQSKVCQQQQQQTFERQPTAEKETDCIYAELFVALNAIENSAS